MQFCKLCTQKAATKNNSHIITWALIKESINQEGKKDRDYDVSFSISSYATPSVHIGRSVIPEQINDILKSADIEDISTKENPFCRDNIFCPECEYRLGNLESEFINSIYNKIDTYERKQVDSKGNYTILLSPQKTKLAIIFAYSLFFRTSIVKFNNFSIESRLEETLREILFTVTNKKESINSIDLSRLIFPVSICYLETPENKIGENLVTQTHSKQPYFIWANRLTFQLFKKPIHIKSSIEYLYGLSNFINATDYYPYSDSMQMKICVLPNQKREAVIKNTLQFMAESNMKNMKELFFQVCVKALKRKPTVDETNVFFYYYSNYSTEKIHENLKEPFNKAFYKTFNIPAI